MEEIKQYQKFVESMMSEECRKDPLLNGVLGLVGESGECADLLKKVRFQGHPLDKEKLKDELGDVLWYICCTAYGLGISIEEVIQKNISKLNARYPQGHFTSEDSLNRPKSK